MFLAGITVATLLWADLSNVYVWVMLMVTLAFGGLGFMDDYAKVTKQTTAGISGRARLAVEAGVAVLAVFLMVRFGQPSPEGAHLSTSLAFPIFKKAAVRPRVVLSGVRRLHHRRRVERGELHRRAGRPGDRAR